MTSKIETVEQAVEIIRKCLSAYDKALADLAIETADHKQTADGCREEVQSLAARVRELEVALAGMIGLLDLINANAALAPELKNILMTNHRVVTARAALQEKPE